ncbi:Ribophorin I-domain-containing protein [Globomyces pollinis-pini]|nr:Ribophorin I-domain-containing protein [Globomyces pollinis-pini]
MNDNVKVTTTLATSITRQVIDVSASATSPTSDYFVVIPSKLATKLSFIGVKQDSASLTPSQPVTKGFLTTFKVPLSDRVPKGGKVELAITLVWADLVSPYPKVISQTDSNQKYLYTGNLYFFSPYSTTSQATVVKLPNSKEPVSYSEDFDNVKRTSNQITYGPYSNIPELTEKVFKIHYFNNDAALVVKKFEKTVRLSAWSPELLVQEDFEVHHKGAALKGHFSRVDYKLNQYQHHMTNVVKSFKAILPSRAYDVYYKDAIGNISTSHFRKERTQSVLELQPRYPIYGGWRFSWFHGYTVTDSLALKEIDDPDAKPVDLPIDISKMFPIDLSSTTYELKLRMTPSIKGLPLQTSVLKVILPEGATNIRVESPFFIDTEKRSTTFTYFDTTGRPTVVLEKSNVVDDFSDPIKIIYSRPNYVSYQKPAAIVTVTVSVLLGLWLLSLLDLTIIKDKKTVEKELVTKLKLKISGLVAKEKAAKTALNMSLNSYKLIKKLERLKESETSNFSIMTSCQSVIANVAKQTPFHPTFQAKVSLLANHFTDKINLIKKKHSLVQTFVESKSDDEDKSDEFTEQIEIVESKLRATQTLIDACLVDIEAL